MLRGAQVLRLQAGVPEGRGVGPALPADEKQLRVHQEEDLPTHAPAGKLVVLVFEVEGEREETCLLKVWPLSMHVKYSLNICHTVNIQHTWWSVTRSFMISLLVLPDVHA